jgi:hypothetical protein
MLAVAVQLLNNYQFRFLFIRDIKKRQLTAESNLLIEVLGRDHIAIQ